MKTRRYTNAAYDLWNEEYDKLQIIPGSTRTTPSKALVIASRLTSFLKMHSVLDVGCGNGRNAVWLARQFGSRVYAVDSSSAALHEAESLARSHRGSTLVTPVNASITKPLPFPDRKFDLIVDSYVTFDLQRKCQERYWQEALRVLKPGGYYFASLFHLDDEYYRQFVRTKSINPVSRIPESGLTMRLWREEDARSYIKKQGLRLTHFFRLEFEDIVQERPYWRVILAILAQKSKNAE